MKTQTICMRYKDFVSRFEYQIQIKKQFEEAGLGANSDLKQKMVESLSNVSLSNSNEIDKALKPEAPESLAQGWFTFIVCYI